MTLIPGETNVGNYLMREQIGSGAFASVWLATHLTSQSNVAIKVISKASLQNANSKTRFNREVSILKRMHHPFIAEFFESIEDDRNYYLIMEYAENGNMSNFVNSKGQLTELQARHYFSELISVLDYLHEDRKVVHRDLKSENILLDKYNNIRVIDFGLSNVFTLNNPQLSTACGSPTYAAPEMIKGQSYTTAADIWSAGIFLYSIVAGHLPYDDENIQRLLQKIVYTDVHYPGFMSPPLVDLLKKMLAKNPEARITLDKIKEHHWFSQTDSAFLSTTINQYIDDRHIVENGIDKEIVNQMIILGVDVHPLHEQLLSTEFTNLTSIYKMLRKEKITEEMKDILANLQKMTCVQGHNKPGLIKYGFPPTTNRMPLYSGGQNQQGTPRQLPMPMPLSRPSRLIGPNPPNGPRMLQVPAPVQIATRRMSRPVALRKTMDMSNRTGASLEA